VARLRAWSARGAASWRFSFQAGLYSARTGWLLPALKGEAVRAVDRSVSPGLERDLGVYAALGADGGEHLALPALEAAATTAATTTVSTTATATGTATGEAATGVPLAGGPAVGASAWFVGESLAGKELLLTRSELEVRTTISATQGLVWHLSLTPWEQGWHGSASDLRVGGE
jgi:hypothetical protein